MTCSDLLVLVCVSFLCLFLSVRLWSRPRVNKAGLMSSRETQTGSFLSMRCFNPKTATGKSTLILCPSAEQSFMSPLINPAFLTRYQLARLVKLVDDDDHVALLNYTSKRNFKNHNT